MATKDLTLSPNCTIGPFFPASFVDGLNDLTRRAGCIAMGQHIVIAGRVMEAGKAPDDPPGPTRNTILEIWQPDASGIFRHPLDPRHAEADPGFEGFGRARTPADGSFQFRTVLPGAYSENGRLRCPHVNLMLLAIGITHRLVTTIFFGDGSESDAVLDCVTDREARQRLYAVRDPALDDAGALGYRFDILLRGANETPFFRD